MTVPRGQPIVVKEPRVVKVVGELVAVVVGLVLAVLVVGLVVLVVVGADVVVDACVVVVGALVVVVGALVVVLMTSARWFTAPVSPPIAVVSATTAPASPILPPMFMGQHAMAG